MKRALYLCTSIVVVGLVSGCSDSRQNNVMGMDAIPVAAREGDEDPSPEPICESGATVALEAGNRDHDAGFVTMATDGTTLLVQISTEDRWQLAESQVAVGSSLDDIPQRRGKPIPRHFDNAVVHESGTVDYQFSIDLSSYEFELGDEIYVVAHSTVTRLNPRDRAAQRAEAWAAGEEFPGRSRASYVHFTLGDCTDDGGGSGD